MRRISRCVTRAGKWSKRVKVVSAVVGAVVVGGVAFAASNWTVNFASSPGSEGGAAAAPQNITIAAVTGGVTNLLYPGSNGDVEASIQNPNGYPVVITAVGLPSNTTYAAGYSNSGLTTAISGCAAGSPSYVIWNHAPGTADTTAAHTLTTSITVGASSTLYVLFQSDASMSTPAPSACEGAYFSLPSITAIAATGQAATASTGTQASPFLTGWTS